MEASLPAWAQALQIAPEKISEWSTQSMGHSLLHWALSHQKVDQQDYLRWARNHYQISSVNDDFFHQTPPLPSRTLWQNLLPWGTSLYPIYFWNNTLYVGCLELTDQVKEKAESFSGDFNVAFILCSAQGLSKHWENQQAQSLGIANSVAEPVSMSDFAIDFSKLSNEPQEPEVSEITPSKVSISMEEDESSKSFSQTLPPLEEKSTAWSKEIFEEMDTYFDSKMIIEKTDEGFVPKHWSGLWTRKDTSRCPFVNVKEPNIFRIAHRSQRPFHGPVSANQINDEFFDFWHNANYPQEITIQPIQSGAETIGMIVGIPRDTEETHKKLQLAFNLSQKAQEGMAKAS